MNDHRNNLRRPLSNFRPAILPILSAIALIAGANPVSANLTVDCRLTTISGNGTVTDSKHANNVAVRDVLNIQMWAQITFPSGIGNGRFGIGWLEGGILTHGVSQGVTGDASFDWTTDAFPGFATGSTNLQWSGANLDLNGDGSGDIGTYSYAASSDFLRVTSNSSAGYQGALPKGQQTVFLSAPGVVSTTFLNSAYVQGSSWNVINGGPSGANGIELLIGTFHFTIGSLGDGTSVGLNFAHASLMTTPFTASAGWYDGTTVVRNGTPFNTPYLLTGADVVASSAAPEPAAWMILAAGCLLLAFTQKPRRQIS